MLPWAFGKNCSGRSEQAIIECGLNWEVHKTPLFVHDEESYQVPDYAIWRRDIKKRLGVVGKVYQPLQNIDAFKFMDNLIESNHLEYVKGGSIDNGSRIFLVGKIPAAFFNVSGQTHQAYVTFMNGHDGQFSITAYPADVRINSVYVLNAGFRIRHSSKLDEQMQEGAKTLQNSINLFERYGDKLRVLATHSMTDSEFFNFAATVSANIHNIHSSEVTISSEDIQKYKSNRLTKSRNNHVDTAVSLLESFKIENQELSTLANTAYNAFNAVNRWANFRQRYNGSPLKKSETRFQHLISGKMRKVQALALDTLVENYGV